MKKPLIITSLTFTLLLLTFHLKAQPTIQWEKSLGGSNIETALSSDITSDGGYILVGNSNSNDGDVIGNNGGNDYWVVKLDVNGVMLWEKTYGGSGDDAISTILQTPNGGYIFAASTLSNDGDITNSYVNWDYWIVKIDSMGNIVWEKSYGGSSVDITGDIKLTADSGFIVVGYTESNDGIVSTNKGGRDYWIIKIDSIGNLQWEKSYGGSNDEEAYSVVQTNDLGYIVVGESISNDGDVTTNYGSNDYWLVKLDSLGNLLWEKNYGGSGFDRGKSVVSNSSGGYLIAGRSDSNDGDVTLNKGVDDYWIVNIDSLGNILWQKNYGGTASDDFQKMVTTNDGGYVMIGSSGSSDGDVTANYGSWDYWVVKIDSVGNIEWEKNLGGSSADFGYTINQSTDNGFIVAGQSSSVDFDVTNNIGFADFWVVKLGAFTGINEQKLSRNLIYPNPNNGIFNVITPFSKGFIRVTDLLGKVIFNKKITAKQTTINLQQFTKGTYLLKYITKDKLITQKIILK